MLGLRIRALEAFLSSCLTAATWPDVLLSGRTGRISLLIMQSLENVSPFTTQGYPGSVSKGNETGCERLAMWTSKRKPTQLSYDCGNSTRNTAKHRHKYSHVEPDSDVDDKSWAATL